MHCVLMFFYYNEYFVYIISDGEQSLKKKSTSVKSNRSDNITVRIMIC